MTELLPDRASRLTAAWVVAISLLIFLGLAPFATVQLSPFSAFIPVHQTILFFNDMVTALLLIAQLRVTRNRAVLVLACGYLFSALMTGVHMLTFPGVFAAGGILGGGPQTTAYMFVFWHTGFALYAMAYGFLEDARQLHSPKPAVWLAITGTLFLVIGLSLLATGGSNFLPAVMDSNRYTSAFSAVRFGQWIVTGAVAILLWRKRSRSIMDLWLSVALTASFFEIGLAAIFNQGRYDVGFYAGRVYGLLASSFVLGALFMEQVRMYSGVVDAQATARSEAELRHGREVLRFAMVGGRMGAWSRNLATDALWWSPELESIFGFEAGGFPRTTDAFRSLIHPDDRALFLAAVQVAIADHTEYAQEFRFWHTSGEWRWMDGRGRASYDGAGKPTEVFGIGIDITVRKHSEEAATKIEAAFQTMTDGMPQLAWMARPDGWIYWYNKRWYEFTGTEPADMEGWGWQRVHDPDTLPSVLEAWKRSIATGDAFEMIFPLRGKDGKFKTFLTRVSPFTDGNGKVVHWFGTNTDITMQYEIEEQLRDTDRRKDAFLATLVHELRNPLAPMRYAIDIMTHAGALPANLERARQVLDRQSNHMSRLVDDLLEVSRIKHDKLRLELASVSLRKLLEEAVDAVKPAVEAAKLELLFVANKDSLDAIGDSTRLTQIFANLLNNAVKFTPAGGSIVVRTARLDNFAEILFRDSGVGIAPEQIGGIFELFSQAPASLEQSSGGLGIGLVLVRGFVERHGGRVEARSDGVGRGADFIVRLHLKAPIAELLAEDGDGVQV